MSVRIPSTEKKAAAFIAGKIETDGRATVNLRFDRALLERVDADAKRNGVSRSAWLHVAAAKALEG